MTCLDSRGACKSETVVSSATQEWDLGNSLLQEWDPWNTSETRETNEALVTSHKSEALVTSSRSHKSETFVTSSHKNETLLVTKHCMCA